MATLQVLGSMLPLLSDIRIAHGEIQMGQPDINVGFLNIIGTRLMSIKLRHSRPVELDITGRLFSDQEVLEANL